MAKKKKQNSGDWADNSADKEVSDGLEAESEETDLLDEEEDLKGGADELDEEEF